MTTDAITTATLDPAIRRKARDVLSVARAIFRGRAPYWYNALCKLIVVEAPGLATYAVSSRGQLLHDPSTTVQWADQWGTDTIAGVLAHEVLHIILEHLLRRGNRTPRRWNIAADLFINCLLRDAGWKLPPVGVFPEQFKHKTTGAPLPGGLTADEYYDLLPDYENDQGGDADKDGNGQEGPCNGDCGSGAGGEAMPEEPEAGANGGSDGERSLDELRKAAEDAARETANAAKSNPGSVPGAMRRWAEQALKPPVVPWTQVLNRAGTAVMAKAGRGRRSYRRPHRRQSCMGAHPRTPVLPSRETNVCDVWFAVDTSGSMSARDLTRAASEIDSVLRRRKGRVATLACDAAVQGEPKTVKSIQEVLPMLRGGGGTDFRPIFAKVMEQPAKARPDLVVVITDGFGPAPETAPPGVAVIWVITEGGRAPVSWGEIIHINESKLRAA